MTSVHFLQMKPSQPGSSRKIQDCVRRYQRARSLPVRSWRMVRRRGATRLGAVRELTYRVAKRTFDIGFALLLMIAFSPLMFFIGLAIKLTDRGPILYWQSRVGMWGETFPFPKFRSMVVRADQMVDTLAAQNHHGASITFKIKRDPRVTWIGRIIRRFSLDEFPQLWCVLRGDMSLVGPRPALPREVYNYTQEHRRRLGVRPGLTCIWQVSGRADIPFEKQVLMDVDYVESHTFWLDLKLVASTVPAVLTGRGAY
ncbi:MAG TPA: sugar transferase [Bryobacteraceae bacterium]|jgi:lipopolysaccharide/colanic/teichoic acid biosynthesis glycosyltransferase|nr:sugar transferase [Bryobacteraceae bacterium]